MRFTIVRQAIGEASSTSSSSVEHEEQPRVSTGAPNTFKDSRQQKCKTNRARKCNICTPLGHFSLDHT